MKRILLTSRKKEMLLTIVSNLSLQFVTAICGFILPPLIIKTFGSPVNGMVSSITQFIAYLNLVEAGVGGASITALYKPLAQENSEQRNAILSATAKFYNRSGIVFTILILVLAFLYPMIVGSQVDRIQASLMVLVLGITGAAEFFLIGKYRVLLTADKKVYVISLVQMLALVLSTAAAVFIIKIGQGIVIVKLVSALIFLLRYIVIFFYVHKHYTDVDFHSKPDNQAINQSKNVLVHQIGKLIVYNSPVVIITIFCSLKDASIYAVYAMVFSAISQLLGSFCNGMQSFFGESLIVDSIDYTRKFFSKYETIFFLVEGWIYAMAYLLILPFMKIYTVDMTDAVYLQPRLAIMFIIVGVLNNLRTPANQLINAAGHFKKTQWRSIIEAIINVVFSCFITLRYGFIGVLAGSICSGIYRCTDMIVYTSRNVLLSFHLCFVTLIKILIFIVFFICQVLLIQLVHFSVCSYFQWILLACGYGCVLIFPISLFLVFTKKRGDL